MEKRGHKDTNLHEEKVDSLSEEELFSVANFDLASSRKRAPNFLVPSVCEAKNSFQKEDSKETFGSWRSCLIPFLFYVHSPQMKNPFPLGLVVQ